MSAGRRRALLVAVAAVVVLLAAAWVLRGTEVDLPGVPRNADLAALAAEADRLVVGPVPESFGAGLSLPADREIRGREAARELLELMRINEPRAFLGHYSTSRCMCAGTWLVRFHQDDEEIAAISLHHGNRIRWRGGPWQSDAMLTRTARTALPRWFTDNGYPFIEDGVPDLIPPFRQQ